MTQREKQDGRVDEAAPTDADPVQEPPTRSNSPMAEIDEIAGEGESEGGAVDPGIVASAGTAHGWALDAAEAGEAEAVLADSLVPEGQQSNPGVDPTGAEAAGRTGPAGPDT